MGSTLIAENIQDLAHQYHALPGDGREAGDPQRRDKTTVLALR